MKPVLAIDIGGSKVMCGIVESSGNILKTSCVSVDSFLGFSHVWNSVLQCVEQVIQYAPNGIDCIGAAIPGLADPDRGTWIYAPFSGIENIPIAKMLTEKYKVPAYIENDVNACAVGEAVFGKCIGVNHYLWVTVSNGIGGGVVADGRLLRGAAGNSGEIGHIKVEYDLSKAFKCGCGGFGCVEAMAAGPGIVKRYLQKCTTLNQGISAKDIAALARQGNHTAIEVYEDTGTYLGRAIAAAANILNPEVVILGGGIILDYELFKDSLNKELALHLFRQGNQSITVTTTGLSYFAALLGATAIAIQ